ncbi:hypothetical protein FHS78_002150 [Parvibaculum indicum]|uniref:lipid A deacylase LpxR family protein n=1 Tax=Parvibaculum indicum TaxID=562969 RepID=UPI00142407E2|nr:lipid A deacylase LpxR family protein [Parvibaculum indicum]NIJ41860.1 hypothetical protein [Parvibaculum indicum]
MRLSVLASLVLAALAGAQALPARAAEDNGFVSFQSDNDFYLFIGSDRHYTNGVRASWLSAPRRDLPNWLKGVSAPPVIHGEVDTEKTRHRVGIGLSQAIFTPEDTETALPVPNDRPYAGWLHLTFLLQSERTMKNDRHEAFQDRWQLDLGVVGPAAFGEAVQNGWHRAFGFRHINGWGNQLKNEPGVNLTFERAWRSPLLSTPRVIGFATDLIPYGTLALGNVSTYAGAGATFRIGPTLPDDFGPTGIYPNDGGSDWFESSAPGIFDWYLFAGGNVRAVGHNIFLDGNSFQDSLSVDKKPVVADLKVGAVAVFQGVRISLTNVYRTKEFYGQRKADQFGSLSVTFGL